MVVGLGNPGPAYAETRHNVGFRVVDRLAVETGARMCADRFQALAATVELSGTRVTLLQPQSFMNLSGPPVAAWLEAARLPLARLLLIHDDLDLPLGRLRVVGSGGPGGHRGVTSVQATLGSQDFPRVRAGIGRPDEGQDAADRVLEEFLPAELPVVAEMVERAAAAVRTLIRAGLAVAMNRYNMRVEAPGAAL